MAQKSICIITENLSEPVDEGIKHFAHSLIASCPPDYKVLGLAVRQPGRNGHADTVALNINRLFLDNNLRKNLRGFSPDVICYVPSASATLFSFLRGRMLKLLSPGGKVVMVSLQLRDYNWLARRLIRFLSPDAVFVQNETAVKRLTALGCRAVLLPSGVDSKKFVPVSTQKKLELRAKYSLDPKAFTILHVGHLTKGRNVELLIRAHQELNAQAVLVSSGLIHDDRQSLRAELVKNGVVVIDRYLPDIEELYQLSDCYLFPVFSRGACIGVPLSVLEAMACNIPAVSVRYGNLPAVFKESDGLFYGSSPDELIAAIVKVKTLAVCRTREKVIPYSWQAVTNFILEQTTKEVKN